MNAKNDSSCDPVNSAFALTAWVLLAWSWRGSDGPFLMGTIAICCWALLSHAQNPMPSISRGLLISSGTWLGALIFGEFSRLSETGVYGTAEMVGLLEWASLLLFLPAGLLLFRRQKYVLWLLLAPVLAVVARILSHISYETWQSDLFGRGLNGFGLHTRL